MPPAPPKKTSKAASPQPSAKKPAAKKPAPSSGSGSGRNIGIYGLMLGAFFTGLLFLPTSIILTIGMVPTFLTILFERDSERNAPIAVGVLNFVGVMPPIMQLWRTGHTLPNALNIMLQTNSWVLMYGSAIGGWFVYFILPPIVAAWVTIRTESKIDGLKEIQKKLEKQWGNDVSTL